MFFLVSYVGEATDEVITMGPVGDPTGSTGFLRGCRRGKYSSDSSLVWTLVSSVIPLQWTMSSRMCSML